MLWSKSIAHRGRNVNKLASAFGWQRLCITKWLDFWEKEDKADMLLKSGQGRKRSLGYSPKLNKIEMLRENIKYDRLGFAAYKPWENLKLYLEELLKNFNKDYIINFG